MATDRDKEFAGVETEFAALGLADLPFDILRMIVWNERLSQRRVAALRLTCRALAAVANTRLFYRIAISKLNADRDAFLAICHSPHLAFHVHEVEWLEISYDVNLFDRIGDHLIGNHRIGNPRPADLAPLLGCFQDQAEQTFWMPNIPPFPAGFPGADTEAVRQTAVTAFRGPFLAAVDMLPNLHTFISRPMASGRIINLPGSEYEITASLFQRFQINIGPPAAPQTNDGLFFFLIPAMDRPSSPVTGLRWADEFPGLSYCRALPPSAFERLESLELCFTPSSLITDTDIRDLEAACIRAAPSLRHLKLCMEHGPCNALAEIERMILGPGLALAPGCNLRSLALVAVTCDADLLHRAIKANARSLRHLYFDSMYVENQSILRLAKLHTLQLDTLQIVDECAYTYCQSALVRYVNGERPSEDPFKQISCHKTPLSKRNACSCWAEQVYDEMDQDDGPPRIVTKSQIYIDSDSDSNVDSEGSVGPLTTRGMRQNGRGLASSTRALARRPSFSGRCRIHIQRAT